jgi:hypothetical protein
MILVEWRLVFRLFFRLRIWFGILLLEAVAPRDTPYNNVILMCR